MTNDHRPPLDIATVKTGVPGPPSTDRRDLPFAKVVRPGLSLPSVYDFEWYTGHPPLDYDVGNTQYGDCTIATQGLLNQLFDARETGARYTRIPRENLLADYFNLTGGSDSGLDTRTGLKFWRDTGHTGADGQPYKIDWWANVEPGDRENVRGAIYTFGAVALTLALPQGWQERWSFTDTQMFDEDAGEPASWGGGHAYHRIPVDCYSEFGVLGVFASWFSTRHWITWKALERYGLAVEAAADATNSGRVEALVNTRRVAELVSEAREYPDVQPLSEAERRELEDA